MSVGTDSDHHHESTGALLQGLVLDMKDLAVAHGESLRGEVGHELRVLTRSLKIFLIALAIVSIGTMLLVLAVGRAAAEFLDVPIWASFGVTALLLIVGGVTLALAVKPSRQVADGKADLVPETAIGDARANVDFVKEQAGRVLRHGSHDH